MDNEGSQHDRDVQSETSELWVEKEPNPNESANTERVTKTLSEFSEGEGDKPRKSKAVTISKGPQSVVNSSGIVLPYTRAELRPTETWSVDPDEKQTIDDLFPPSISSEDQALETEPRSQIKSPVTHSTQTDDDRQSIEPISTHAKKAKQDRQAGVAQSGTSGSNDNQGSTVRVRNEQKTESNEQTPTEVEKSNKHDDNLSHTLSEGEFIEEDCPECEGDIIEEGSDKYCTDCGLLLADQQIDPGPEWRSFDSGEGESRSRVGGPMKNNVHDKGLSTVIGSENTDAHGKPLSSKMRNKMKRLRKWDRRFKVKNTKERNLRQAFGEIQRISSEMDLPDYVEETACTVYRRALDEELLPGRSIEAMASASVYIAMRQASIPKTLDHLIEYCRVEESHVTGAYSYLGRELGIEIQPPEVLEYIGRVCSELDVSKRTERKAEDILQASIEKKLHSGKAPAGMAAASVYAATMVTRCDRVTQEEASEAGDVCPLTIRNRQRELLDAYGIDYEDVSPPSDEEIEQANLEVNDSTGYSTGEEPRSETTVTAD